MSRRLHFIDWLRVSAVLLLFPFHTWRIFNAGDPFYVKAPYQSHTINAVIWFIDFWHMPLLFLLAGASTYFALRKRNGLQYLGERFTRIFIPLLVGWVLLIPPQTWYGARFNSGYTGSFVHYMASGDWLKWNVQGGGDFYGGFGIGHLWFLLYLFFIAIMALPLLLWWRSNRGSRVAGGFSRFIAHPWAWPVVGLLFLLGEALPSPIDDKRYFYFLVLFVLGFVVMADDRFMDSAERNRIPALIGGVTIVIVRMLFADFYEATPDPSWLRTVLTITSFTGIWMVLVGLLGMGKRYLDAPSKQLAYLAEGSYTLYILHQTVIVVLAFYLIRLPGPWFLQWAVLLVAAVAGTFALYEVVRRLGPLRFLFGLKAAPKPEPVLAEAEAEASA